MSLLDLILFRYDEYLGFAVNNSSMFDSIDENTESSQYFPKHSHATGPLGLNFDCT